MCVKAPSAFHSNFLSSLFLSSFCCCCLFLRSDNSCHKRLWVCHLRSHTPLLPSSLAIADFLPYYTLYINVCVEINGKTIKWKLNIYNYLSPFMVNYYHTSSTLKNLSSTQEAIATKTVRTIFLLPIFFRVYWKGLFFDVNFSDATKRFCWIFIRVREVVWGEIEKKSHKNVSINFLPSSFYCYYYSLFKKTFLYSHHINIYPYSADEKIFEVYGYARPYREWNLRRWRNVSEKRSKWQMAIFSSPFSSPFHLSNISHYYYSINCNEYLFRTFL